MSGPSTSAERDTQLLEIGIPCSSPTCHLVDFLPFKCQHCAQPFCGDHFLPEAHKCDKYDAAKHDRVAPSCPLCNTPVAIPPGQDPNIRMERHINSECSVVTGRTVKKATPTCARAKCGKVLFSPIRCDTCKQQFCPSHRFPNDHDCAAPAPATSKLGPSVNAWASKVSTQTGAASMAAVAAMKRAAANAPSRVPTKPAKASAQPAPKPSGSSTKSNPFSATDRTTILITTPPTIVAPSADDPNDPPERCSPKPTVTPANYWSSFVPPSGFPAMA